MNRARLLAITAFGVFCLALSATLALPSSAADSDPIHASADKEIWNRSVNRVELIGHAQVHQIGESLAADYIILDQTLRTLDAHGNCIYIANDTVIFGEEMHFNLDTRTGTVISGRVTNDKFTLAGERINKLSPTRFQTHWGDYSTCKDCPQSWTFSSRDVDMEVDGYAYMRDVTIKIDDASTLWIPYLILPMKTRRQTGFIYPEYAFNSNNGFQFVEPFFWAINRSADMTLGAGTYMSRGPRLEWEGRYALSPRSTGKANFYYLHDNQFVSQDPDNPGENPGGNPNRWGLTTTATQELGTHAEAKLKLAEVSDNLYPYRFADMNSGNVTSEAFLTSSLNASYSTSDVFANAGAYRFRNLLDINDNPRTFDPTTVQAFPSVSVTTRDRYLFGAPILGGLNVGATNFTRTSGPIDLDSIQYAYGYPGQPAPPSDYRLCNPANVSSTISSSASPQSVGCDPIRKATRFSLSPSVYTVLTPTEGISIVPSMQYFYYYYAFHNEVPDLKRSYALAQLDLVTQFEKVYDLDDPKVPRRKHLIRPILTYSYIPYVADDPSHPFSEQMTYANNNNKLGYNFDDQDIIPLTTLQSQNTYFTPLGNSLTYGFKTQLLDRHETLMGNGKVNPDAPPIYRIPLEFTLGETFNIYEYHAPRYSDNGVGVPRPFSLVTANLITNYNDKITSNTTYYYDPTLPGVRSALNSTVSWIFEKSMHQRILAYERSFTVGFNLDQRGYTNSGYEAFGSGTDTMSVGLNYSLSDYILPQFTYGWDFLNHKQTLLSVMLAFQSPSQCWKITTGFSFDPNLGRTTNPPSISLNLVGNGFEGISDISQSSTLVNQ